MKAQITVAVESITKETPTAHKKNLFFPEFILDA